MGCARCPGRANHRAVDLSNEQPLGEYARLEVRDAEAHGVAGCDARVAGLVRLHNLEARAGEDLARPIDPVTEVGLWDAVESLHRQRRPQSEPAGLEQVEQRLGGDKRLRHVFEYL